MGDRDGSSRTAADLPPALVDRLETLEPPQLRAVSTYVDRRLAGARPPTADEVRADADGEVIDVATHDAYTLVWKQLPGTAGPGSGSPITSLYAVRREPTPDGERSLHWAYLGDLQETAETECEDCGATVAPHATTCHRCGVALVDEPEGV